MIRTAQSRKMWYYLEDLHLTLPDLSRRSVIANFVMLFIPLILSRIVDASPPLFWPCFGPILLAIANSQMTAPSTVASLHWFVFFDILSRTLPLEVCLSKACRQRTVSAPEQRILLQTLQTYTNLAADWIFNGAIALFWPDITSGTLTRLVASPLLVVLTVLLHWIPYVAMEWPRITSLSYLRQQVLGHPGERQHALRQWWASLRLTLRDIRLPRSVGNLRSVARNRAFVVLALWGVWDALRGLLYADLSPFYLHYVLGWQGARANSFMALFSTVQWVVGTSATSLWTWVLTRPLAGTPEGQAIRRPRPDWATWRTLWKWGKLAEIGLGVLIFWFGPCWGGWGYLILVSLMIFVCAGTGLFQGQAQMAMLDQDQLLSAGPAHDASLSANQGFFTSLVGLPGNSLSFYLLRRSGFEPSTSSSPSSSSTTTTLALAPKAVHTINLLAALVPSLTGLGSLCLVWLFPIDEPQHKAICERLRIRAASPEEPDRSNNN
eukprot:GAFH01001528.1.p1 GENE.GAFH01001528.1~~GAFH01001528.1.p1  ORF type:complete len:516 (-),score=34.75 GAFH01001528.1:23-1501(-)